MPKIILPIEHLNGIPVINYFSKELEAEIEAIRNQQL